MHELTWPQIEKTLTAVDRILLYGPPGTGKSTTPLLWGEKRGYGTHSITLTEEMSNSEFRGFYIQGEKRGFIWRDGITSKSWRASKERCQVVVLNEIDKASGDVATFLHNALDDPEIARLDLPNGETLKPANRVIVVASMNGDPTELGMALRDRFDAVINVTKPHPAAIATLPKDLQQAAKGDLPQEISFRAWKRFAKLRETMELTLAGQLAFGEHAPGILRSLEVAKL